MKATLSLLTLAMLVFVAGAAGKDFRPGDLRVCNAARCIPIRDAAALRAVGSFYYGTTELRRTPRPAIGARTYQLRFRNGYVTGIVAGVRLDRFLSYGVNLDRFATDRWYAVPARLAQELRRLTSRLAPLRLSAAMLAESH